MKKNELMEFVGKKVFVYLKDVCIYGTLRYANDFSEKHFYHTPGCFYIGYNAFKASQVKKVVDNSTD